MLEKDPDMRISVKEALNHPWFTMESLDMNTLSIENENMMKCFKEVYFNVEHIKPEFNKMKFRPLMGNSTNKLIIVPPGLMKLSADSSSTSEISHKPNKEHNLVKESKYVPIPGSYDTSNFLEDDISEGNDELCFSVNPSLIYNGLRSCRNSHIKYKESHLSPQYRKGNLNNDFAHIKLKLIKENPTLNHNLNAKNFSMALEGEDISEIVPEITGIPAIPSITPHELAKEKWANGNI